MPPARVEFCGALMFSELQQAARDDGSEHLLTCFTRGCLERMLYVELQRSKGTVVEAASKVASNLKRIEAAVEALHEHERHMDKDFFEMLVKADSFLVSGRQAGTGNPLYWYKWGQVDGWKIRGDSPKAHALIRNSLYTFQLATARVISEGLFQSHKQHPVIIMDCSPAGIASVNFKVIEREQFLLAEIFDPLEASIVFAGTSAITRAIVKCGKAIFETSERWTFLDKKEDVLSIVEDPKDIPHWWSESNAKYGARRDPADPREYWCWKRCLSSENPISVQDFFNPDPETWLDGCETHTDRKPVSKPSTVEPYSMTSGEKARSPWTESNEASLVQQQEIVPGTRIDSGKHLEVIEEDEYEEAW